MSIKGVSLSDYKPRYDLAGARIWYERGHTGYYMKNFIGTDSRIDIIKDWVTTKIPAGSKVVDIGCGDMSLANLMPGYDWSGFDLDPKKDPRIIKQDVSTTPYDCKPGSYDGLICSEVLEHVFEPHVVVAEFNRLLKMKGIGIITVPNFDNFEFYLKDHKQLLFNLREFWTLEHIRWYNHENMIELLNSNGFRVLETMGTAHCFSGIMQYAADATIKLMKSRFGVDLTIAEAGMILGKQFPLHSPGMAFLCQKVM